MVISLTITTGLPQVIPQQVSDEGSTNGMLKSIPAPSSNRIIPAITPDVSVLTSESSYSPDNWTFSRGIMHFTYEQLLKKESLRASMPRIASYQEEPLPKASKSLLSLVPYIGDNRDQGSCGNCWVWAGTGALEVEHMIDSGICDRLSVQYFNSNWNGGGSTGNACDGGNPYHLANFYSSTLHKVIPWSNTNAGYADGGWVSGPSNMPASSIVTTPNYQISGVTDAVLGTHSGQSPAINIIKAEIDADKPVMWGFLLPSNGWTAFFSFWNTLPESAVWDPDIYNDGTINGGHEVLIIGYDDTADTPYWLVLNSWGTTATRPGGLFRLKMYMDYDGRMNLGGYSFYAHDFDIFNTEFAETTSTPTPTPTVTPTSTVTPTPTVTLTPTVTPTPTVVPVVPVPGGTGIPHDIDGDGRYEDVNGNSLYEFADVVLYFNEQEWIVVNEPIVCFDYNGNGKIDLDDVIWLFDNV